MMPDRTESKPDAQAAAFFLTLFQDTHKPHRLFKTTDGKLFEFISYPWSENNRVYVNGRVPGDPTSLRTFEAYQCHPEHMSCHCAAAGKDFYLSPEYYKKREREG